MKVHLVDGTFELFRAFFGAPAATNRAGREVGAARGFAQSMLRLLRESDVTHVAVAFDHVVESFRNDLFEGYKTGEGIEPVLLQQFELVEQVASALGMTCWPMVEFEADDALATGAQRFSPLVEQVVICSPDKDLAQCAVAPNVVLWDRIRNSRLDADAVVSKFGVLPESIPDYLALVGDSADGIPGIPRWGKKSAAQVLQRYVHLEAIPPRVEDWEVSVRGAATLATNLRDNYEQARLYRQLATLRVDVPLSEHLQDLCYRGANPEQMREICEELDDPGLMDRVQTAARAPES